MSICTEADLRDELSTSDEVTISELKQMIRALLDIIDNQNERINKLENDVNLTMVLC